MGDGDDKLCETIRIRCAVEVSVRQWPDTGDSRERPIYSDHKRLAELARDASATNADIALAQNIDYGRCRNLRHIRVQHKGLRRIRPHYDAVDRRCSGVGGCESLYRVACVADSDRLTGQKQMPRSDLARFDPLRMCSSDATRLQPGHTERQHHRRGRIADLPSTRKAAHDWLLVEYAVEEVTNGLHYGSFTLLFYWLGHG
jgi:hypothetical protein